MSREYFFYLEDINKSCKKILRYTHGLSVEQFKDDDKTYDAVIRNLEIIGESAKQIPSEICAIMPNIEWRKAAGLRDMLVHAYFGIDNVILWDVITNKIPDLLQASQVILLHIKNKNSTNFK